MDAIGSCHLRDIYLQIRETVWTDASDGRPFNKFNWRLKAKSTPKSWSSIGAGRAPAITEFGSIIKTCTIKINLPVLSDLSDCVLIYLEYCNY